MASRNKREIYRRSSENAAQRMLRNFRASQLRNKMRWRARAIERNYIRRWGGEIRWAPDGRPYWQPPKGWKGKKLMEIPGVPSRN